MSAEDLFRLAANMGSGLNECAWAGGLEISTQMGSAACGGIVSLGLAVAGVTSSSTVLEGKNGLFASYSNNGNTGFASSHFRKLL